jgi:PAS domain S-box-containing protein
MPQKIFIAKPNGEVDYFNPQWTEFTGLPFEQIGDWGWTQFIHADDVAENVRIWRQSLDTGEPFLFEHRFRRADGEYRWHISRALPMRDAQDRIVMWIGSSTDVHEQQQTANKLQQLAADLSEADRRKNEFLAMLAHELRNPLAPIRNALQVMRLTGDNGETVHSAFEMMERQIGQMVRLVDDLLDVSRISRGKIELRKKRVELASVEACRPAMESAKQDLTITLPPRPVYLHADPMRLAQVIGNLLSNACKFSDKGGRIWLTIEREGEHALIRVRDTGIGIPPDQLQRIFGIFAQVDTSLERSVSGLGIGLTLVKSVVEMHGGTVEAYSAGTGQGSELVVRLPLPGDEWRLASDQKEEAGGDPVATHDSPVITEAKRRILVVDDNPDSAASLAMLLQISGNETHTAHDGLEALAAAERFRPDVVLLDIGLPQLNGYDACRRIRAEPWGKTMVLIALTGWGQEEDRRKSKDAGFDAHLVKPVDYGALMELLATLPAEQEG